MSLLFKLGIFTKHYVLKWDGEIVSTNKFYEARHWTVRAGLKVKYTKIFEPLLLQAKVKPFKELSLVVFYNTRFDVDNLSIMGKMLIDVMKGKYIENDTNKTFVSTHTICDKTLKKGMVEFHLIGK